MKACCLSPGAGQGLAHILHWIGILAKCMATFVHTHTAATTKALGGAHLFVLFLTLADVLSQLCLPPHKQPTGAIIITSRPALPPCLQAQALHCTLSVPSSQPFPPYLGYALPPPTCQYLRDNTGTERGWRQKKHLLPPPTSTVFSRRGKGGRGGRAHKQPKKEHNF